MFDEVSTAAADSSVWWVDLSVQNLMIQETSPGVDGQQYTLRFTADIGDIADIPSFDLPFLFYNGWWHFNVVIPVYNSV